MPKEKVVEFISGNLGKLGSHKILWKTRYVKVIVDRVARTGTFKYYDDESSEIPRAVIPLTSYDTIKQTDSTGRPFTFKIFSSVNPTVRKYYLAASDKDELGAWMKAFSKVFAFQSRKHTSPQQDYEQTPNDTTKKSNRKHKRKDNHEGKGSNEGSDDVYQAFETKATSIIEEEKENAEQQDGDDRSSGKTDVSEKQKYKNNEENVAEQACNSEDESNDLDDEQNNGAAIL